KVMGYLTILDNGTDAVGSGDTDGTDNEYEMLKTAVSESLDSFFAWSVTGESEVIAENGTKYYFHSASGTVEVSKSTYEAIQKQGGKVSMEASSEAKKQVEYT